VSVCRRGDVWLLLPLWSPHKPPSQSSRCFFWCLIRRIYSFSLSKVFRRLHIRGLPVPPSDYHDPDGNPTSFDRPISLLGCSLTVLTGPAAAQSVFGTAMDRQL
jgi:hypothetical protein